MSSQFYHVNAYGREAGRGKEGKHTIYSIADEAERIHGSCPHIDNPTSPVVLYGCSPRDAVEQAKTWAEASTDSRGHRLRKDGHCLLAGVVSVPSDFTDTMWGPYKDQTISYLSIKYGDCLKSVVEHTDEQYRHIHFYVVPRIGDRFDTIHEGIKAMNEANPDRGKKSLNKQKVEKQIDRKLGNYAYAMAMRKVQDDFWTNVSSRFGLSRIGPKRRRLTRKEVREQKQRENEIAMAYEQVERLKRSLSNEYSIHKDHLLQKTQERLDKIQSDYLIKQKELAASQEQTDKEQKQAKAEKEAANLEKKEAHALAVKAKRAIQEYQAGKAILDENLIQREYDGANVPKPKFMESAQKYSERVYDDLKWIAGMYKDQALKQLPNVSSLKMELEQIKQREQMKDYELTQMREAIAAFRSLSPEELINIANERAVMQHKDSCNNQSIRKK